MDQESKIPPKKISKSSVILGGDLLKFYHRSLDSSYKSTYAVSEPEEEGHIGTNGSNEKYSPKFQSQGVQTDYRESEAQTDPWDPPFRVSKVIKEPEVLSLKGFTFGNGLPAGLLELKYISEMRENENLKSNLGCDVNDDTFAQKKQIICDQVENDWNYRISVLNQKQQEKLLNNISSIVEEMQKNSDKKEKKLRNMWTNRKAVMSEKNMKLQKNLDKELKNLESDSMKKDQRLKCHNNFEELSVKPLMNKGRSSRGIDYMLSNYYLSNPAGLLAVRNWLETKADVLTAEIPLPQVIKRTQQEKLSAKAYQDILNKRQTKLPPVVYHEDYVREETPVPSVKAEDVLEDYTFQEKKIDLVTVWQQVLRGFAYQKQMLELIERHKDALSTVLSPLYPEMDGS